MQQTKQKRVRRAGAEHPKPPPAPAPVSAVRDHPQSRVVAHFVAEFLLRSAASISKIFDHDYETAILFITISNRTADKIMADPTLRAQYGSYQTELPPEHVLLISRMALARATGLPRETVRRKVAKLIERGWVIELPGGLRTQPDISRDKHYIGVLEPIAPNLRRLFAKLLGSGALNAV